MKIVATSCWHLDLTTCKHDRHEEIVAAAKQVLDYCVGADLLVHLGDVFDNNRPSPRAYAAAISLFRDVMCPVLVVPGNHDFGAWPPLAALEGVTVVDRPKAIGCEGKRFLCVPHFARMDVEQREVNIMFEDARRSWREDDGDGRIDAVFCHLDVVGAVMSNGEIMDTSDVGPYIPVVVGKTLPCPVVNGHIHKRQKLGRNIYMPGSVLQANHGEAGEEKGCIRLEV